MDTPEAERVLEAAIAVVAVRVASRGVPSTATPLRVSPTLITHNSIQDLGMVHQEPLPRPLTLEEQRVVHLEAATTAAQLTGPTKTTPTSSNTATCPALLTAFSQAWIIPTAEGAT